MAGGFYGPYRGVVTNTSDPAGENRLKAVVPQLFGNTSTECDWALPCQPGGYTVVPQPGMGVWIMFEGGDINYPVYMGMWQEDAAIAPYDPAGSAAAAIATSEEYTISAVEVETARAQAAETALLPGKLLAEKNISHPNYATTSASFVCVDSTNAILSFTAPASGKVLLRAATVWADSAAGVGVVTTWSVGTVNNTGLLSGSNKIGTPNGAIYMSPEQYVSLTPGNAYTLALQWAVYGTAGTIGAGQAIADLNLTACVAL